MMTDRELFKAAIKGQADGRFPIMEFMGFWPETIRRWQQTHDVPEDVFSHFGLVRQEIAPIDFNPMPPFAQTVLEEDDRFAVIQDATGVIKKIEKNASSMPHYISFPIKDRKTFDDFCRRLDPSDPRRYPANWLDQIDKYRRCQSPVGLIIRGPFAFCRDFISFEQLMTLVYDDYHLLCQMMAFQTDFIIRLWEPLLKCRCVDFVYLGEDMAYKNGPMFAPSLCETLLAPLYRKLTDFFVQHGVEIVILDSDGDIRPLLPLIFHSGFTCILPLERAAGMDPVALRRQWPRLQFIGGVDKMNIAQGKPAIDVEMSRLEPTIKQGGWIPSLDHSVPPIVAYEDYCYYLEQIRKLANT